MKFSYLFKAMLVSGMVLSTFLAKAQSNDELLNLLIQKKVITKHDADSLRADLAKEQQIKKDSQKMYPLSLGRAFNLSGILQTRYQAYQGNSGVDGFDVRRARLDLKGALTDHWDYELYIEFAGTPELLDAYTSYKFGDYLKITAGQFKIPFSVDNLTADNQLEFIDRSQVEEALAARAKDVIGNQVGRDIGAEISGSFLKYNNHYVFDYTLAVLNGDGIDKTADNNNNKDIAGRFTFHPVSNLGISYDFYQGHDVWGTSTVTQIRNRRGVDARYVDGPLSLTAEYDRGTDGLIDRSGWYGQAAYFIVPQKIQLAGRYDSYNTNLAITTDRTIWYLGGINYFFNNWTKLYINYTFKREETAVQVPNNLFAAEIQVQF